MEKIFSSLFLRYLPFAMREDREKNRPVKRKRKAKKEIFFRKSQ